MEAAYENAHQNEIASQRNESGGDVEFRQSPPGFPPGRRGPIVPRPTLMPDKVVQHGQLNCHRSRREIAYGIRGVGKNKKRG